MNREDIIRLAMEADFIPIAVLNHAESLHRFADLVLADNASMVWQQGCDAGRRSEREAILDLVDSYAKNNTDLAEAIRARGNT